MSTYIYPMVVIVLTSTVPFNKRCYFRRSILSRIIIWMELKQKHWRSSMLDVIKVISYVSISVTFPMWCVGFWLFHFTSTVDSAVVHPVYSWVLLIESTTTSIVPSISGQLFRLTEGKENGGLETFRWEHIWWHTKKDKSRFTA